MRQQKFKIGDKVEVKQAALTWCLNNPDAYEVSTTGQLSDELAYDIQCNIGLASLLGEKFVGTITRIGAEDDKNDYFYRVKLDTVFGIEESYHDIKDLLRR